MVKAEEQKVEKALQVFGAVEEKPAHPTWSSWQQLSKFQAEQVANAPGIIEIRVEGATDTIFVESGKSVRDYARRRLIDPERWMSPPEKALLQRGYAMEFRHAVAETKEQARAWKGDYLRQYVEQKKSASWQRASSKTCQWITPFSRHNWPEITGTTANLRAQPRHRRTCRPSLPTKSETQAAFAHVTLTQRAIVRL